MATGLDYRKSVDEMETGVRKPFGLNAMGEGAHATYTTLVIRQHQVRKRGGEAVVKSLHAGPRTSFLPV